jgi:hypothetical protein
MLATLVDLLTYLGIVVAGFLIWAALSPFEVMGWWAGWFGDRIYDGGVSPGHEGQQNRSDPGAYLIFMSGVGKATGETLSYREQEFLRRLAQAVPQLVIIDDLFPYSVNNLPLTGQPFFARVWRWALQRKLHGPQLAGYLINVRNIWQLLISADRRYGPMYNQALAEVIVHGLMRYHYDLAAGAPVFVMGYSGAGQLAVGPAAYLKEWLQAPVYIITLGGVFASDPSMLAVDHFYHLYGRRDSVHHYGLVAPGRWPLTVTSDWNRAKRQGKVSEIDMGDVGHTGRGGYLDHKRFLPDGASHMDHTVAVVARVITSHLGEVAAEPASEGDAAFSPPAQPVGLAGDLT